MTSIEPRREYETWRQIWLRSVTATHRFLQKEDLDFYYGRMLQEYLPNVEPYAIRNKCGNLCAFIGLGKDMIEMLFVHPDAMGQGYGSALLRFATEEKGLTKVDVNEQNIRALDFYRKHGFSVAGRSDTDGEGRPYPILHLELTASI